MFQYSNIISVKQERPTNQEDSPSYQTNLEMLAKVTIFFLLLVTAFGKSLVKDANFDVVCPESEDGYAVFVPHPYDCSLYYECRGRTPVLMSCPAGLYFDSRINVCNWPEYADCDVSTTSTTTTTTTASTTTSETIINSTTTTVSPTTTEISTNSTPYRVKRSAVCPGGNIRDCLARCGALDGSWVSTEECLLYSACVIECVQWCP